LDAFVLFIEIAQIIIAATIVSVVLKKLKQPTLLAYLLAGVLLGPLVLGSMDFSSLGLPFVIGIKSITPEVKLLSALGTALLLFSIGIETSIHRLLNVGKSVVLGSILQVVLVILFTFLLTVPMGLLGLEQALFIGTILAFSSTMIVVKLLSDSNELNSLKGRLMVSILLLQDFLVIFFVPLLAHISNLGNVNLLISLIAKSLLLIAVAVLMNRFVFPRLFRVAHEEQELFLLASIATAFVFIGLSELIGIPIAIGAFVGGLALSTLPYNLEIFSKIRALRDFFLTIFFVSLGIQLSFGFSAVNPLLVLVVLIILFIIKPLIFFGVSLLLGYGSKMGVKLGLSLFQISEFGFELAAIAAATTMSFGEKVFSPELFSFIVTIIALSMIITPYVMESSSRIAQYFYDRASKLPHSIRRGFFRRKLDELEKLPSKKELDDHIIILGGGTVGRELTKALLRDNQVIVVDKDPEVVMQGQRDGLPYVYGTSDNEVLLDKLDLPNAKMLVITILDHTEAINMIKQVKKFARKLPVFAIAHYFSDSLDFYKSGAEFVCMPAVIGSNVFLQKITEFINTGKMAKVNRFENEFINYLEEKVREEKKYHPRN
jgi:CPA2 family monovalent cation:H+ antiporter-2